jgi:serine protease Do
VIVRLTTSCVVLATLMLAARSSDAADSLRQKEEQAIKAAVARVAPSVVRIETVGGLERIGQLLVGTGPTTGLVVSADGFIVSSAFNFVQKPASILVSVPGGGRHAARLVATDHSRMLVLLKIEADAPLTVPEAAPVGEVRVGQWALAVGRTFEVDQPNVSVGIISARDRIWGKALQTDAKISPNNYGGPLVDIAGRVLGVLVPMSPDAGGEMAGVEWYDSGIGFAVPLVDVLSVLPKWSQGVDLRPGLLGINTKGADIYADMPEIAATRATGPAYKAGLRAGDKIVAAGGAPIARVAELKHRLGRLYAGDKVQLTATRGEQKIEVEVELVDKIEPYEFPFLGVLPKRFFNAAADPGLVVRWVYPDSPAATAGIQPGDRITTIGGKAIASAAVAAQELLTVEPGEVVKLEVKRGEQTLPLEVTLGKLPETLPGELPAAHDELPPAAAEQPAKGVVELKLPEFENNCIGYVPESYRNDLPHGLIVWLHAPGGFDQDKLVELWKPLCEAHGFILLAPQSADKAGWKPTEVRFVRKMVDDVRRRYTIDPTRLVAHGHQGGGALAYVLGFTSPDEVKAMAVVDAPLPRGVNPPETEPTRRQALYTTLATKSEFAPAVEAGIERLREARYPLTVKSVGEQGRYLTAEELTELVRWFDTLDRL